MYIKVIRSFKIQTMRKAHIFIIIVVTLIVASCKKEYTCDCTTNTVVKTSIPGFPSTPITIPSSTSSKAYSEKMTNAQATAACDHEKLTLESTQEAAFREGFGQYAAFITFSYSTRCSLK